VNRTIPWLFRAAVEDVPDKVWLTAGDGDGGGDGDGTRAYTYRDALGQIEKAASWFRATGVGPHDRVLVTARNTPDYLLTWLALMEVGAIQVPINPASTDAELAGLLGQVTPSLIVSDPALGPRVDEAGKSAGSISRRVDVSELFEAPADGRGPASVDPGDVAVMIPTSGTTGRSKLVMQTQFGYVMAGEGFPYWLGLTGDDRLMTSLPLFHINAPAYSTLGSVAARASLILLPRFSASGFIDSARRHGATEFNSIGAMLEILMRQPPRPDDADNPVRRCYTGPSPDRERQLEIEQRFGFEIVCGYALSETPYGLVWARGTRPYGTLGSPRQHPDLGQVNEARVMDGERPAAVGAPGELELRNPVVMRGYYQMPEETAAVLDDGWLRTGDLVTDNGDGTYTFVGRKKEVIRRRGENLSPTEVEGVLERHAGVAAAAVVGVPSDLSEEDVKAFITSASGRIDDVDIGDLRAFAAERLAPFKVPRYFEVVDELPHTATGRIAKHRLPTERTPSEIDCEAM
jgi:carnitine-CoA ligase